MNLEKLFSIIRKDRNVYDFSYKIYNLLKPGYVYVAKYLLPEFAFERKTNSLANIQKQKNVPEISIIKGEVHVVVDSHKFIYIPESEGGGCINVLTSESELFMSKVINSFIRKDSVFIDAGANFGFFSIMSASSILSGKIFAFEPVPKTLGYLKKNVMLNKLSDSMFPQGVALSDNDGVAYVTTNKFGGNHITQAKNKNSVRIRTVKLDTFVKDKNILRVDLIKADVEGAELLLLKGGEKTISKHKPVIVLEIQKKWVRRFNYSPKELFDFLQFKGYSYKLILKDQLLAGTNYNNIDRDLERTSNLVFFNKKELAN